MAKSARGDLGWNRLGAAVSLIAVLIVSGCHPAPEKTVLRVWDWWSPVEGEAMTSYFKGLEEAFERTHPGVDVEFQHIPFGPQYIQKIMAGMAAGHPPDVLHSSIIWVSDLYERGVLSDMSHYLAGTPEFADDAWLPTALRYGRDGSYVYGIPIEHDACCLVYNLDLFEQAGISTEPFAFKSWEDLRQAALRLTKRDPDGRVTQAGCMVLGSTVYDYLPWIYANGGRFYSEDERKAAFNTPEVREALQFVQDLQFKDRVSFPLASERQDMQLFVQGKVAMFMGGTWMGHLFEEQAPSLRFGLTSFPPGPHGKGRSGMVWTNQMCIPKGAANPDLAWEFIRYYCGIENAAWKLKSISRNSPLAAFYDTQEWKTTVEGHPSLAMIPHITSVGGPYPTVRYTEVEEMFRPQCEGLALNNLRPQQVLDDLEPRVNAVLDSYWKELEEAYH